MLLLLEVMLLAAPAVCSQLVSGRGHDEHQRLQPVLKGHS